MIVLLQNLTQLDCQSSTSNCGHSPPYHLAATSFMADSQETIGNTARSGLTRMFTAWQQKWTCMQSTPQPLMPSIKTTLLEDMVWTGSDGPETHERGHIKAKRDRPSQELSIVQDSIQVCKASRSAQLAVTNFVGGHISSAAEEHLHEWWGLL